MAGLRIKKGDLVQLITGADKGKQAKVLAVQPAKYTVTLEGIGQFERRLKPSQLNPRGGTKKVHLAVPVSKVALVHPDAPGKVTRVSYVVKDGTKTRVATQAGKKEIK